MSAPEDAGMLTTGEVAALFGVDSYSPTRWAASGRLVSLRTPGGKYRFFAAEVGALLRGVPRETARDLGLAAKAALTARPGT